MTGGRLITIEGLDGSGKTTLAGGLIEALRDRGIDARLLREPGGVGAAERIRELVKDPNLVIGDRAEALLYAAARAQLVQEAVRPALNSGAWVVLDRFVDSSLAYQGGGRALGRDQIRAINRFATDGLVADRTLLLTLDPGLGLARAGWRGEPADRLERETSEFFARVARAYEELAAAEPERIVMIDASQPPELVLASSLGALSELL